MEAAGLGNARRGIVETFHVEPFRLEMIGDQFGDIGFVVHDEDLFLLHGGSNIGARGSLSSELAGVT